MKRSDEKYELGQCIAHRTYGDCHVTAITHDYCDGPRVTYSVLLLQCGHIIHEQTEDMFIEIHEQIARLPRPHHDDGNKERIVYTLQLLSGAYCNCHMRRHGVTRPDPMCHETKCAYRVKMAGSSELET